MLFSREVCSAFRGGIFEADLKAVKSSALPSDFLFDLWIFLDVCYNFAFIATTSKLFGYSLKRR